ncbi:MAG: MFS transporter [Candidatus Limnocylindrales bacterium]
MQRSLVAVLSGTFTLRFSTGLTGTLLVYYLADLPRHGGASVDPTVVGLLAAMFFVAELVLSPPFGMLSDRLGQRPVMQLGPGFGAIAVVLTGLTTSIPLLGLTRLLEGGSSAASVPSILGYVARATADDEPLRGRAVARFELATLAGLGAGMVAAGPCYQLIGRTAFFLNALIYVGSWVIYRFGVRELPIAAGPLEPPPRPGLRRYAGLLASSQVWLLAPTWIAVNAAIGLWTSQSLYQLVRRADSPIAHRQLLMGGFTPTQVSVGLSVGLLVFFAGLLYWGGRFRTLRRTTIILAGIVGGAFSMGCTFVVNHSGGAPVLVPIVFVLGAAIGLFVLAGATPAALGLLADVSEGHPHDRGTIMGLYSVFLALGQVTGSLVGGAAARWQGIDGLLGATMVLLAIAVIPLWRLRAFEHQLDTGAARLRSEP